MTTRERRETILWTRLDTPGHEIAEQTRTANGWLLRGIALFAQQGMSCRLEYEIQCDPDWLSRLATVRGRVGPAAVDVEILANSAGEWSVNGSKVWEVTGCEDIDLNFSPSTNMLPVRRLNLAVGQSSSVRAAWLRFPSFSLELLEQTYTRSDPDTYVYESANGKFRRELTIDASGFVLEYPGLWHAEARHSSE